MCSLMATSLGDKITRQHKKDNNNAQENEWWEWNRWPTRKWDKGGERGDKLSESWMAAGVKDKRMQLLPKNKGWTKKLMTKAVTC